MSRLDVWARCVYRCYPFPPSPLPPTPTPPPPPPPPPQHTEAVSLLVDEEPETLKETKPFIEAARNGKPRVDYSHECIQSKKQLIVALYENSSHLCLVGVLYMCMYMYMYVCVWYFMCPGRKEVVEILLEAGMDPNCMDVASGQCAYSHVYKQKGTRNIAMLIVGTCPLHEAVRFFRYVHTF